MKLMNETQCLSKHSNPGVSLWLEVVILLAVFFGFVVTAFVFSPLLIWGWWVYFDFVLLVMDKFIRVFVNPIYIV